MRYFSEKPPIYSTLYGELYICNHPIYDRATLFKIKDRGLCVIQQRFDARTKSTYWTEIDDWLNDQLYLHEGFKSFFDSRAAVCMNGLYPTVSIRQIMWALKMKPLKKEQWETVFDRKQV